MMTHCDFNISDNFAFSDQNARVILREEMLPIKISDDDDVDEDEYDKNNNKNPGRNKARNNDFNFPNDPRRKGFPDNHPSAEKLQDFAKNLLKEVAKRNNDPEFVHDAKCDTFVVGFCEGEIIIAANLKERRRTDSKNKLEHTTVTAQDNTIVKVKHVDYGINKDIVDTVVKEIKKSSVYKKSKLNVTIIEEKVNPRYIMKNCPT